MGRGGREALARVTFEVEEEEASVDSRSIPERVVERACEAGSTFVIALEEADDDRSIEDMAKGSERKQGSIFDTEGDCESVEVVEGNTREPASPLDTDKEGSVGEPTSLLDVLRLARVETSVDSKIWQRSTESLKGVFKGHGHWGLPQRLLATVGCIRGFRGLYKEHTLGSSAKTLRSPEVKGELSRFKLKRKYRKCRRIYMWRPGARTKQCS